MPATISLTRISMGWVYATVCPGRSDTTTSMARTSSDWERATRHFFRGLRVMNTSVNSVPIGSVAISAVPILAKT